MCVSGVLRIASIYGQISRRARFHSPAHCDTDKRLGLAFVPPVSVRRKDTERTYANCYS